MADIIFKANVNGQVANYSFDAVVEETVEFETEFTGYPLENGVTINDHRIIKPARYTVRGITSNTPLKVSVTDFAGGLVSNLSDNPLIGAVTGISAGYLAGSSDSRTAAAMQTFIDIMEGAEPFDVDTGEIQLKNMCITHITRTRNPETENALEVVLDLQEMILLDRINPDNGQPSHKKMRPDSVEPAAGAREKILRIVTQAEDTAGKWASEAKELISGVTGKIDSAIAGVL